MADNKLFDIAKEYSDTDDTFTDETIAPNDINTDGYKLLEDEYAEDDDFTDEEEVIVTDDEINGCLAEIDVIRQEVDNNRNEYRQLRNNIQYTIDELEHLLADHDTDNRYEPPPPRVQLPEIIPQVITPIPIPIVEIRRRPVRRTAISITMEALPNLPSLPPLNSYICNKCYAAFALQYQLNEHMIIHENDIANNVCICNRCRQVFNSDEDYLAHNRNCIGNTNNAQIPTDENGEYPCPACNNRYANQFYLGEHFIESHNDYTELTELDKRAIATGFPGLELLEKIGMIRYVRLEEETDTCKICYFDYIIDEEMDELDEENRSPLMLLCCNKMICCSCITQQLGTTNNLICPFCIKDHTRDDWDYVTYIDEVKITDRAKWIPWWEEHLEIFY